MKYCIKFKTGNNITHFLRDWDPKNPHNWYAPDSAERLYIASLKEMRFIYYFIKNCSTLIKMPLIRQYEILC